MVTLLRSTAFNVVMFGSAAVCSLIALALARVAPQRVLPFARSWASFVLASLRLICGVHLELTGAENLPQAGGALIAAQHQSAYDTLIWMALLPRPAYVLKQELLRMPLFGPALMAAGQIAVDRAGGMGALRKLIEDARRASADNRQIVIFPEGTRVAPGARGVLQPGIVALSRSLDLPIIPIATNSGLFWARKAYVKRPGRLRVHVFPPLPVRLRRDEAMASLASHFYEDGVENSVGEIVKNFSGKVSVDG